MPLVEQVSWCEQHNCPIVKLNFKTDYACLESLKKAIKEFEK